MITFDDNGLHKRLSPLTLTRPVCDLRFGIRTIRESWCALLEADPEVATFKTESYLNVKYPAPEHGGLSVAGNVKPDKEVADWVKSLKSNERLRINGRWVASGSNKAETVIEKQKDDLLRIENIWDLFQMADRAIELDYTLLTANRVSAPIDGTNTIIGNRIFLEEGAKISCSIINTETGPVYVGKDSEILEGCMIRGPFAMGEHAALKMGAKIYGATVVGPFSKVGGEVSNSIFQAYSNKGHDGFVGNSVIGEWCNFGADTNTSNLKNNYSNVRLYSYETDTMEEAEVLFCGVIMGDHSKTGINTMLNTATSVGVSANIFDSGFPPKYIPSFSWGGRDATKFEFNKACEVAERMMSRRGVEFTAADKAILAHLSA